MPISNPKAELVASLKTRILQLDIEIGKADLMASAAEEEGELRSAAEDRARRLRLDLKESRENLRAADAAAATAE